MLKIEQKKGDSHKLHGKLTVYAIVEPDTSSSGIRQHPIASMIHNNLLVAQGNYREQSSLKDFLMSEIGGDFEEGLEEFIGKLDGLEGALDPEKLKERMKHFDDMKEFIPTPAKIVPFHSEHEILQEEGDIFFVGHFKNPANANLSVNSLPIMYQARYREQEIVMVQNEIDNLISQIETGVSLEPDAHYTDENIDISDKLLKIYIPEMLYARKDAKELEGSLSKFRDFMKGYRFNDDVERIINIIKGHEELTKEHYTLIEFIAKKIDRVRVEDFKEVESIQKKIDDLTNYLEK